MAGENEQKNYLIFYAASFMESLKENIREWEEELAIPEEKIRTFIQSIDRSINLLKLFPEMYENVASIYGFSEPSYRILIGSSYGIFYRIDHENKRILIGNFFKQKQLHLRF